MRHQAIRPAQGAETFRRTAPAAVLRRIEREGLPPEGGEVA